MFSIPYNSRIKSWRNREHSGRIKGTKPFINKYNWQGIHFQSEKDDRKKTEKNNVTIAVNVLYIIKEKNIYPAYISKHNSDHEK